MSEEKKLYGVSYGDGNDGVSQLFPSFYCWTDAPFDLAELALISIMKEGAGQDWAKRNVETDGEAEFTISATLYNPPCEDTEDGEYPEVDDPEKAEDGRNWSDHNGAWKICEVFPVDEEDCREGRPIYDSLEECFGAEFVTKYRAEG